MGGKIYRINEEEGRESNKIVKEGIKTLRRENNKIVEDEEGIKRFRREIISLWRRRREIKNEKGEG